MPPLFGRRLKLDYVIKMAQDRWLEFAALSNCWNLRKKGVADIWLIEVLGPATRVQFQ